MSPFPYFGPAIHALLHHLKAAATDGYIPPFESLEGCVEDIVRTSGRHIPRGALWTLMPYESDTLLRHWKALYTTLTGYDTFWLKAHVEGRKHDIIGQREGQVDMIDVLTGRFNPSSITLWNHRSYREHLADCGATLTLLERVCGVSVRTKIVLIKNDLETWHEPVWLETTL